MPSPEVDEQETQVRPLYRVQVSDSLSFQAQSDDRDIPPPFTQPEQDNLNFSDYVHDNPEDVNSDDNQQGSNTTTCVEETQYVQLEIDTQASEDPLSPTSKNLLEKGNRKIREVPGPLPQPAFIPESVDLVGQPKLLARPTTETLDDIGNDFMFAIPPKPRGSYTGRLLPSNPAEERTVQTSSKDSPVHTESSHQITQKASAVEEPRGSLPSHDGCSKSIVPAREESPYVPPNMTAPDKHQNSASPPVAGDPVQKINLSKSTRNKARQEDAPAKIVLYLSSSTHAYAIPQNIPSLRAGAPAMLKTHNMASRIPTPPHGSFVPTPVAKEKRQSKPAAPPFASLELEKSEHVAAQSPLPTTQGQANKRCRGPKDNPEKPGNEQENPAIPSCPPGELQGPGLNTILQQSLHRQVATGHNGNLAQKAIWNNDKAPQTDRFRQAVPQAFIEDANRRYGDWNLPDVQVNTLQPSNHQQVQQQAQQQAQQQEKGYQQVHQHPTCKTSNRPLHASQLQPQSIPQSMPKGTKGVTKVSRSGSKSKTPEVSSYNSGQPGQLKVGTNPTSVDILQMVMFMAQNEQEQSQAAELQIREQHLKIERLVNENAALQREVRSVLGEKGQLGVELVKLRERSESYKTHINEVIRSQKHLEKLILKSNEKQEQLEKEIQERVDFAQKQVQEAGVQVNSLRSGLAERVEKGIKHANQHIERLSLSYQQLKKELNQKALELQYEREQCQKLETKLEKCQPDQEAMLQKLHEHFESVAKQLNGHEGKLSSIISGEEANKSKFDECLTMLSTIQNKETPEPPALGELVKMIETISTRIENRFVSDGEAQSNLREEGRGLLDDLKDRVEAIRTDQEAQEALRDHISNLKEANASLKEKIKAIEVELGTLKIKHIGIEAKYDGCKEQLIAAKEELSRAKALPREDPSVVQNLQTRNASLSSQVDTISKEIASANEQLALQQKKSQSDQKQADVLTDKLREAENFVSSFNEHKLKYEHAKTQESIQLRKELEKTLAAKLAEKTLEHKNIEKSLTRAKITAEEKLGTALEQAAKINRLEKGIDTITESYNSVSKELHLTRSEILQCSQLVTESENKVAKSSEIVQKARDEATQHLKDIEKHAETEISKLKRQIVDLQQKHSESVKLHVAFPRHLSSKGYIKDGQDLNQWANETQAEIPEAEAQVIRAPEPNLKSSARRVSFQTSPPVQQQPPNIGQSSSPKNALQEASSAPTRSSRSGRPWRIAERKSSVSQVVNPAHMSELDNMLMQRTEITEFSVRTSKTYESHRNTSQTPLHITENSDMRRSQSSPMTDLEPVLADEKALETGQGIEKALEKQRSIKRSPQDSNHDRIKVQVKKAPLTKSEEAFRRREEQTPKSAMKRPRTAPTPRNSSKKPMSAGNGGEGITSSSARRDNQQIHALGTMPYNKIVTGNGASRQQQSYKNSSLSRQLAGAVVTKSGENGDDHPAKMQRTISRTVLPQSQGESQVSSYIPSQEF